MEILQIIINIIIVYFMLLGLGYTALLIASYPHVLRCFREAAYGNILELMDAKQVPPVSVIIPVYNEDKRGLLSNCVASVLNSTYKNVDIIIVNDGSTDTTMQQLIEQYALYEAPLAIKTKIATQTPILHYYKSLKYPRLVVLDKGPNNGAADAINAGINACRTPIFLTLDADTVLDPKALSHLLFTFLSQPHCVSVGGALFLLNDNTVENGVILKPRLPRGYVSLMQVPEFLRSFLYGRAGWDTFGGALSYPGAFTLFKTEKVISIGGYDAGNSSYDVEIVAKLHDNMRTNRERYAIHFAANAYAWTEMPKTLNTYWKQRNRWQRGSMRSIFAHIHMLFNPRYGIVGFFSMPFYLAFEIFSGVAEFTAYMTFIAAWYFDIPDFKTTGFIFFALAWGYLLFLTMACCILNLVTFNRYRRVLDTVDMLCLATLETVGFRQYHVVCRTWATLQYFFNRLRGKKE